MMTISPMVTIAQLFTILSVCTERTWVLASDARIATRTLVLSCYWITRVVA